jgi:hypothetical protein
VDSHDLLKQVMKNIEEALEHAHNRADVASAFDPILPEHLYHPETVVEILDNLLRVEVDGRVGKLHADEGGVFLTGPARVTGRYDIGLGFEGWVWNEEMDRAPRAEDDE